jgi:hypothetical protein
MPDRYGESDEPDLASLFGEPMRETRYGRVTAAEHVQHVAADLVAGAAVDVCELCNADGYRGSTVCDHVDHSAAAKRGIQLIREALARKDQP